MWTTINDDGAFIEQVRQVGTAEARSPTGDLLQIHSGIQLDFLRMNLEDFIASLVVRQIDDHLAVETPWTQQRWVKHIWPVSGGQHDDA